MLWLVLVIGLVVGFFVGDNWRDWLDDGWEWAVSTLAAIGLVAVVVVAAVIGSGWRP